MERTICDAKRYSNLVNLHLGASIFQERKESVFLFEDEGNSLSDQKIISLKDVNSLRVSRRLQPYIVNTTHGKEVITYKDTEKGGTHVVTPLFPSLTSIYKTLMKLHLHNDHASSKLIKVHTETMKPPNPSYKQLPNICYDLIQYFCKDCKKNYNGASTRGSVCFMYQMSLVPETKYTTLMIYIDENTEFMFLRPINVIDFEVMNELYKLFMQIGTPDEININHTCKLISYSLQNKMPIIFPTCEIKCDNGRESDKYLTRIIMNKIGVWMKAADSKIWQLGCSVVQNQMNNTIKANIPCSNISVTAYDLFYKNPAIFDLPEAKRWFPDIQRQFFVDYSNHQTFHCNIKSKVMPINQEASVAVETSSKTQEPTKTVAIQNVGEARKINTIYSRGRRGRGRPRKYL